MRRFRWGSGSAVPDHTSSGRSRRGVSDAPEREMRAGTILALHLVMTDVAGFLAFDASLIER